MRSLCLWLCCLATLPIAHAQGPPHVIRLLSVRSDGAFLKNYTLVNPADAAVVDLAETDWNADGMFSFAYFALRPDVPDSLYEIWVDGRMRQSGRVRDGLYSGTLWKETCWRETDSSGKELLSKDTGVQQWRVQHYVDGYEQGSEAWYYGNGQLRRFCWHDRGHSPLFTEWYRSGKVKDLTFRLNEGLNWSVYFSEAGPIRAVSHIYKPDGFTQSGSVLPIHEGTLEGTAEWKQRGTLVRMVFANNEATDWEIYEGKEGEWKLEGSYHKRVDEE